MKAADCEDGGDLLAYVSLYRKWRPQTFADVVGQESIVTTLKNSLEAGRISHAYLFAGPRGQVKPQWLGFSLRA